MKCPESGYNAPDDSQKSEISCVPLVKAQSNILYTFFVEIIFTK